MTMQGRWRAGWGAATLTALLAWPGGAQAVVLTLANKVDPVPPGGTAVLTIRVSGGGGAGGSATGCFNPPPECVRGTAGCTAGAPACVGNSFTGFFCQNAANEGANCGIGDPPVPDPNLCVRGSGTCSGGINAGFPCTSEANCPGLSYVCIRAFNTGAICGVGIPQAPDSTLCVANPEGYCASGPNFGEACVTHEDCPSDDEENPVEEGTVVKLPIPPGMTFVNADKNGTSDGLNVSWLVPPLQPCGSAGTPQCPLLSAEFIVDPFALVGTNIQAQASGTDPTGTVVSNILELTIGTFRVNRLAMTYSNRDGRDSVAYRVFFTLDPGATISPSEEEFRLRIETASTTITDLGIPPGGFLRSSATAFTKFRTPDPGITTASLREVGPSHYLLRLRARKLDLGTLDELEIAVSLTLGDDTISHLVSLGVRGGGKKFIDLDID